MRFLSSSALPKAPQFIFAASCSAADTMSCSLGTKMPERFLDCLPKDQKGPNVFAVEIRAGATTFRVTALLAPWRGERRRPGSVMTLRLGPRDPGLRP